ncbi:MAG TPA: hypothetical protein VLL28_09845, partial [Hyphomicrobiaceae bacterium]|nr:hypothetical protein [Hyphomicrobiaceae bacterium]
AALAAGRLLTGLRTDPQSRSERQHLYPLALQVDLPSCGQCSILGAARWGMKAASGASPNNTWACGCCGMVHDRDVAAARNSLRPGRQALAEGSPTLSA